jgi:hypothetical protein
MVELQLSISTKWDGLVAGAESSPHLCVSFSRSATEKHFLLSDQPQTISVWLPVPVNRGLTPDSALLAWGFVDVRNDSNEPSTNTAGFASIPLQALLNAVDELRCPFVVTNALLSNPNLPPAQATKGELCVRVLQKTVAPSIGALFRPVKPYHLLQPNEPSIMQSLQAMLAAGAQLYQSAEPTFEATRYLQPPVWSFGNSVVPGHFFALPTADPSPEAFWLNASRIALRRHYPELTLEEAIRQFLEPSTNAHEAATVAAKLVTGNVCHLGTYLSDGILVRSSAVGKRINAKLGLPRIGAAPMTTASPSSSSSKFIPMECFSLGPLRFAGRRGVPVGADCEDFAAEIALQIRELRTLGKSNDPVLAKLATGLSGYLVAHVLAGVKGAQLSDASAATPKQDAEHSDLGGHMFAMLIPAARFAEMSPSSAAALAAFRGDGSERTLILEGTGLVDPASSPEYAARIESLAYLVNNGPAELQRVKFTQPSTLNRTNAFYRVINHLFVPELPAISHVVMRRDPVTNRTTYGADYLEFMNNSRSIFTAAQAPLQPEQMKLVREMLDQRMPTPGFAPPTSPITVLSDEHMRKFTGTEQPLLTPLLRNSVKPGARYDVRDFFARYDQITPQLASALQSLIAAKPRIIGFQYHEENLGPSIGGYMLRFMVER